MVRAYVAVKRQNLHTSRIENALREKVSEECVTVVVLDSIRGQIQAHPRFNVRSVVLRTCAVETAVADSISMKIKSNGVNGLTNCMPDRGRIRLTLLGFFLGWFAYFVICDRDPSYSEPIFMYQWILNQSGVKARLTMDSHNNYTMDVMNLSELTDENPSLLFTELSEGKSEKERVLTNLVGIGKTGNWGVHESKLRFSPKEQGSSRKAGGNCVVYSIR